MHTKIFLIFLVISGSLALSGCLEDFQVTLHEPGIYKGPDDPLLEQSHAVALSERLANGQTDR